MDRILGIITLIIGVTALSVVVSKRAQTANVLTAIFKGVAGLQKAATAPIR